MYSNQVVFTGQLFSDGPLFSGFNNEVKKITLLSGSRHFRGQWAMLFAIAWNTFTHRY